MKNRKWLHLLLILLCVAAFYGYRTMDRLNTDTAAPEISISSQPLQVSVQDPRDALLQGVTAADDTDGDVTSSLVVESVRLTDPNGTVSVRCAAFDKAGNVTRAEREAQYTDYESPEFSLSAPLVFVENSNFDVLNIIGAQDALDGDISHRIRATCLDNRAITSQGKHDVQFRVTNSTGETVELVLPVEVYSSGSYEASVELTDYLVYLKAGTYFNANSYLKSYIRGSETTSLKNGMPENFTLSISGEVDTNTPGVYAVGYTVTYTKVNESNPDLNQSYSGYSKLIVVVEG